MKKPELIIIYPEEPESTNEDVVTATGLQSKIDVKLKNPVICKEEAVPDFGEASNGSRLRKTQKYCNHI